MSAMSTRESEGRFRRLDRGSIGFDAAVLRAGHMPRSGYSRAAAAGHACRSQQPSYVCSKLQLT